MTNKSVKNYSFKKVILGSIIIFFAAALLIYFILLLQQKILAPQSSVIYPSIQQKTPVVNCGTDSDCVPYGTCSVKCVNIIWATKNPDNGPYCGLLLPQFSCKCEQEQCVAEVKDKRFE